MRHLLVPLFAVVAISSSSAAANTTTTDDGLPTIWSAIGRHNQYHIMFQVQMLNSGERFTVEEWTSFDGQQHRLDLISGADNFGRTTYLTNAKTGEIFVYRAYDCKLLNQDAEELKKLAALFRGHPLSVAADQSSRPATIVYGLGALWLEALAEADKVEPFERGSIRNYDIYNVKLRDSPRRDSSSFEFALRFYFKKGFPFVDSIEWISAKSMGGKKALAQVRAKVIQMPAPDEGHPPLAATIAPEIFDIPVGYGCVRSPTYDHPFEVNFGPTLLHGGAPNKALLEVSLSYPRDSSHHSWQTSRYSVSVMRSSMRLNQLVRSYYASLVQFRDPSSGKLRRQRTIWSHFSAEDSSASASASASPDGADSLAVVYNINPDSGECRASHVSSAERSRLVLLDTGTLSADNRDRVGPIKITLDLLQWLFNEWDNFHLIHEKPSELSLILKQASYELRLNELRLGPANNGTQPLWPGPVSIVKEVSLMGQYVAYPFNINDIKLFESYHTKVTILFFSDNLAQVEYKMSLDLFENPTIDVNNMLRQIDISSCIPATAANEREIVVKYPIEDEESRSSLMSMQDVLSTLFCLNLFTSTPIEPTSVSNFAIDFDQFNMFIRFHLLDIPLWQSFTMKRGLSLSRERSVGFREKMSGSLESCAEACEQHGCSRFAYSEPTKRCQLELVDHDTAATTIVENKDFSLFEAPQLKIQRPWSDLDPSGGRKHLRPGELVEILRQFVDYSEGQLEDTSRGANESANIPLTIKIESSLVTGNSVPPQFVAMRPISIHSSLDDAINEILRVAPPAGSGSAEDELVFVADRSKLRADYSILLEERDFDKCEQHDEFGPVSSYAECAANCDDLNCRSFAYCESNKKCSLSRWHNSTLLERNSKHAFTCTISVLDDLTKFEPFGPANLPSKTSSEIDGKSERDCAHFCLDDHNCQGFYFCAAARGEGRASKCYLQREHIHDVNFAGLEPVAAHQLATGGSRRPCHYFARSYLAQFDQFVGKSLLVVSEDNLAAEFAGPDACARKCIESSCVAFDVCLVVDLQAAEPSGSGSASSDKVEQICRLSANSVRRADLSNKRKGCSTFVLSDRSHFMSRSAKTTIMELKQLADYRALNGGELATADVVLDAEKKEAEEGDIMSGLMNILSGSASSSVASIGDERSIVGGSHWLSRLISILFGLFLGVCCAIFFIRKKLSLSEQFEWRQLTVIFGR